MAAIKTEWVTNLLPTNPPLPFKYDAQRKVFLEMKGVGHGDWRPAFDSSLILRNGCQNHTLTLVLKIFYNRVMTDAVPQNLRVPFVEVGPPQRLFALKPWQTAEWEEFLRGVKKEAAKWNNQFWLVPPANFSALDVQQNGRTMRPNVYCHLHLEIYTSLSKAYNKIDVVNFDTQGVPVEQQNTFYSRSDAGRYDSLDPKTAKNQMPDETGKWHKFKNYSTIAHEIGHSIGLPHIGVTHQDPLCRLAVMHQQLSPSGTMLPALFHGGSNGLACYGMYGKAGRGANIMGGGSSFEDSNATPWAERLARHTHTKPEQWKVVRKHAPDPKPV